MLPDWIRRCPSVDGNEARLRFVVPTDTMVSDDTIVNSFVAAVRATHKRWFFYCLARESTTTSSDDHVPRLGKVLAAQLPQQSYT